ncbi:MAG: glutaredoxin family protein [Candidatus Sericytochromatia bacterium]
MNKMLVEIYSKENCSLCDKAKEIIKKVSLDTDFDFVEIDITKNPEIFEKYKYDIPVIHINKIIAFKHRIEEAAFRKKLETRKI